MFELQFRCNFNSFFFFKHLILNGCECRNGHGISQKFDNRNLKIGRKRKSEYFLLILKGSFMIGGVMGHFWSKELFFRFFSNRIFCILSCNSRPSFIISSAGICDAQSNAIRSPNANLTSIQNLRQVILKTTFFALKVHSFQI